MEGFTEETLVSAVAWFVFVLLPDLHALLLALEPCCVCGRETFTNPKSDVVSYPPWVSQRSSLKFSKTKLYCAVRQTMEPLHLLLRQWGNRLSGLPLPLRSSSFSCNSRRASGMCGSPQIAWKISLPLISGIIARYFPWCKRHNTKLYGHGGISHVRFKVMLEYEPLRSL